MFKFAGPVTLWGRVRCGAGFSGIPVAICGAHFVAPDDFEGYEQWNAGFKENRSLKKGAISSVRFPVSSVEATLCWSEQPSVFAGDI